jgi:hypothetical protein
LGNGSLIVAFLAASSFLTITACGGLTAIRLSPQMCQAPLQTSPGAIFAALDPFWYARNERGQRDNWKLSLGEDRYQWLRRTLETSKAKMNSIFIHHLVGGAMHRLRILTTFISSQRCKTPPKFPDSKKSAKVAHTATPK